MLEFMTHYGLSLQRDETTQRIESTKHKARRRTKEGSSYWWNILVKSLLQLFHSERGRPPYI